VPAVVRRYYALHYLLPLGRAREAAEQCALSLREDPLDLLGRVRYAQCLHAAGRRDEGIAELERVLNLDEQQWFAHFILGHHRLGAGETDSAFEHATRAFGLAPWNPSARGLLAAVVAVKGERGRGQALMEPLQSAQVYGAPLAWATFHLYQSELDPCADWVERGIAERHPAMFFFLRAHAPSLLASHRWRGLAKLLNLKDEAQQETEVPKVDKRG
jgi:tetratricopeptide (TPR) repeat protein